MVKIKLCKGQDATKHENAYPFNGHKQTAEQWTNIQQYGDW